MANNITLPPIRAPTFAHHPHILFIDDFRHTKIEVGQTIAIAREIKTAQEAVDVTTQREKRGSLDGGAARPPILSQMTPMASENDTSAQSGNVRKSLWAREKSQGRKAKRRLTPASMNSPSSIFTISTGAGR